MEIVHGTNQFAAFANIFHLIGRVLLLILIRRLNYLLPAPSFSKNIEQQCAELCSLGAKVRVVYSSGSNYFFNLLRPFVSVSFAPLRTQGSHGL